jgi:CheY-like chemotaxis protein
MALRVLLVEDNALAAEATMAALRTMGHIVAIVTSAEAALALWEPGSCDVVITDIALPGMSGWELLERLKGREPGLPVVVLTGSAPEEGAADPRQGRALCLLVKPVDPEDLLSRLGQPGEGRRAGP